MKTVAIVDTGVGNLASLRACFARLGYQAEVASSVEQVEQASRLVLPGVGAFQAAMGQLEQRELVRALQTRLTESRPTLAICLGMQLLAAGSEESPECQGLEHLSTTAQAFPTGVAVPQIGWNSISSQPGCTLLKDGDAYFANSYRWSWTEKLARDLREQKWQCATANHGGDFVAAIERGPVLACQFHPELSGQWGQQLVERWLSNGGSSC